MIQEGAQLISLLKALAASRCTLPDKHRFTVSLSGRIEQASTYYVPQQSCNLT